MKLKAFNKATVGANTKAPALTIGKNGTIAFNKSLAEAMKVKIGDPVQFFQSEDDEQDWYVAKVKSEDSFELRERSDGHLIIQSSGLAKKIAGSFFLEGSFQVKVKPEAVQHDRVNYFLILAGTALATLRAKK